MCYALYLGSDAKTETNKWSVDNPNFSVMALEESEKKVKEHFSKSNIYYLAAHEGCGCGFEFDAEQALRELQDWKDDWQFMSEEMKNEFNGSPDDEQQDYNVRKKNQDDFINLLKLLLQQVSEVEIYVVINGDIKYKPTEKKNITFGELIQQGRFSLLPIDEGDRVFYTVKKDLIQDDIT